MRSPTTAAIAPTAMYKTDTERLNPHSLTALRSSAGNRRSNTANTTHHSAMSGRLFVKSDTTCISRLIKGLLGKHWIRLFFGHSSDHKMRVPCWWMREAMTMVPRISELDASGSICAEVYCENSFLLTERSAFTTVFVMSGC